ncbi:MAG: enoyl-CoA hydratase/isomerase family protein [Bacteroidales bacterium]|nr:enoyl-CoA hydratase/isomerase family protein [Bacteroidales bacterium]
MNKMKTIKFEVRNNIATITMNRPEALNALNNDFFSDMELLLDNIREDNEIRILVITGEGKAFVAGADIAEMVSMDKSKAEKFSSRGQDVFHGLEKLNVPVIAAVNGYALGGGCELAMACDIRVASSKAKFGQPEVSLGLIPGFGGTQRLPRLVGLGNALNLLLTADQISADEALRIGLVQKVTEPEQLMDEVYKLAERILSKGPHSVSLIKKVTHIGLNLDFAKATRLESREFGSLFGNEGTEGMKAFLEKRKPEW